jgi:hypothetical protein
MATVDDRFSKERFTQEFIEKGSAERLVEALRDEVLNELHAMILERLSIVVQRLNEMGHDLKEYYPSVPGDVAFRDDYDEEGTYRCDLRLGVDLYVSAGFRDTISADDEE